MAQRISKLDLSPAAPGAVARSRTLGIRGLCALVLLPLALVAQAQEPGPGQEASAVSNKKKDPEFSIQTRRQQVSLPSTKSLRIINHLGDVRARRAKASDLNVISIVQRFKKDQTDGKTLVNTDGDEVVITTSYPSATQAGSGSKRQGRIDLSLLIPHGADLIVETKDGMIEIKGVHRRIEAKSETGRIRVSTGRRLKAHTDYGTMGITLGSPTQRESAEVSTLTGAIKVDFAGEPMPNLRAQTGGKIVAMYIDSEPTLMEGSQDISVLESGEKPYNLRIESQKGNIFMRALERPRKRGQEKPAVQNNDKTESGKGAQAQPPSSS
jgi:hypothetical protein